LYETTRELVSALRLEGIDSRLVDPDKASNKLHPKEDSDRGAVIGNLDWARTADVLVSHSGFGSFPLHAPAILFAHGRPRHSLLTEAKGGPPVYSFHYRTNKNPKYKSVVTFWPQHKPYLEVMYDKPIHVIQPTVDLDFWSPGETKYDFIGRGAGVNVVCTDAWRDDVDAFAPLNAFALWAKGTDAKLHLYGKPVKAPGWDALIQRINDNGNLGVVQGWASELRNVYRAANLVITGHEIDVRTVREALACNCPVLRIPTSLKANFDGALKQRDSRGIAEKLYTPSVTAKQFLEIVNAVY
jgi:glycosyltransferase involved in cell wall biosynthesis